MKEEIRVTQEYFKLCDNIVRINEYGKMYKTFEFHNKIIHFDSNLVIPGNVIFYNCEVPNRIVNMDIQGTCDLHNTYFYKVDKNFQCKLLIARNSPISFVPRKYTFTYPVEISCTDKNTQLAIISSGKIIFSNNLLIKSRAGLKTIIPNEVCWNPDKSDCRLTICAIGTEYGYNQFLQPFVFTRYMRITPDLINDCIRVGSIVAK